MARCGVMAGSVVAKRIALLLALLGLSLGPSAAEASRGECLLKVEGKTYLNGRCQYHALPDGSLDIGGGRPRVPFAIVTIDPDSGTATAAWNGVERASHAHWNLGEVVRRDGCWVHETPPHTATLCAWKPGTRPR